MILTTDVILLLAQYSVKYGPDAAIALAKLFKDGTTIDEAIAALGVAEGRKFEEYIATAAAKKAAEEAADAQPTT